MIIWIDTQALIVIAIAMVMVAIASWYKPEKRKSEENANS